MERGTVRYNKTESDFQSPNILINSTGTPDWKANEGPPLRKEWLAYIWDVYTNLDKHSLGLATKDR